MVFRVDCVENKILQRYTQNSIHNICIIRLVLYGGMQNGKETR